MRASSCCTPPGVASSPLPARLLPARLLTGWNTSGVPLAEHGSAASRDYKSHETSRRHAGQRLCSVASSTSSEATIFRHPGELDLSLREYMVVLEKPVGLTLAPDPRTGQVVVQDVKAGSPAQKCGLIQVGDVVKSVSAVFGDDMWAANDIRRVRWAINSRMGDVRLILERCRRLGLNGATTSWYSGGKVGVATRELAGMQLPYTFTGPTPDILGNSPGSSSSSGGAVLNGSSSAAATAFGGYGSSSGGFGAGSSTGSSTGSSNGLGAIPGLSTAAAGLAAAAAAAVGGTATPTNTLASISGLADASLLVELPGAGRSMTVSFHRNTVTQPPPSRRAAAAVAARAASLARLRRELQEARHMPRLDLSGQGQPRAVATEAFMNNLPSGASSAAASALGGGPRSASSPSSSSSGAKSPSSSGSSTPGGGGGLKGVAAEAAAAAGLAPPPPVVDVVAPAPSKDGDAPSSSGGGGGGGGGGILGLRFGGGGGGAPAAPAPARGTGPKERRVVSVLPWLLVALGRLEHRHIAHIASSRSLGALLELSLTRSSGSSSSSSSEPAAAGAGAGVASANAANNGTGAASSSGSSTSSPSGSGSGSGSSSSSSSSGSGSSGGYLVVRGSDLAPLGGDMGRVSYASLLATAEAAGNSCAPSSSAAARGGGGAPTTGGGAAGSMATRPPAGPAGEVPPPPPPGSAAATAVLIDGPDALKSAEAAAAAAGGSTDGGAAAAPASLVDAALAAGSAAGNSGSSSNSSSSNNSSGGGLGSSTMALFGRSIFINLRPNFGSPSASAPNPAPGSAGPANGALPSSSSSSTSSASSTSSSASSSSSSGSGRGGLPRYDPARVAHLLNAAASLQRLSFRRGGRLHRARRDACAVLLHCCDEGMESDVAVLLAGWLHWYGRLPLQEAALAAETALGAPVDTGLLEAGTAALLAGGRERCSRVVLTWKYGGLSAYVAGDVVASWAARVPMVRCRSPLGCKGDTHPGHFFLEVTGLPPGAYFYKYIVDGTWAVDSLSNKVLDSAGNWNNVLVVPEPPQVLTSREGLALARWQAARMALEAKMGLTGPGAFMQRGGGPH